MGYIKRERYIRVIGIFSTLAFILLFIYTFTPIYFKTDTAEGVNTPVASETTLTMVTGKETANLDLIVDSTSGTFATSGSNDLAEFNVVTNNYTGYTLTISNASDDGQLINNSASANLDTITSKINATTFNSSTYNGKWGFKPSTYYDSTNGTTVNNTDAATGLYLPSPTTSPTTLAKTSSANSTANNYTIALGARSDYTKASGTYTNTFVLAAIGNPVTYTINYLDDTGDTSVTNLPDAYSSSSMTTSISEPISNTIPTRTGYTFSKWCLGTVNNDGTVCTGTEYASGATLTQDFIDQTSSVNEINLYATWSANTYDITIKTATGISSVSLNGTSCTSASGCVVSNLTYGIGYTLVATTADGYSFSSWSAGNYGTITNTASISTIYTVGAGNSIITPSANIREFSLAVTFEGSGVSSVQVRTASGTGGTLVGTISSSADSVSGLPYGTTYYLYPIFSSGYEFSQWTNLGSYGTLSSTSNFNPTFTIGPGNGVVRITGKISCTKNTFSGYMQDAGSASDYCIGATGSLTDRRDNQVYTVRKLGDGNVWMTRNLAIGCNGSGSNYGSSVISGGKTLHNTDTNISASSWSTPTALLSASSSSTQTADYTTTRMQCDSTYGAWYNYAAASGGTITGSHNIDESTEDICPAGWHLPSGSVNINSYKNVFNVATNGEYQNGSHINTDRGYWWTSSNVTASYSYRVVLHYDQFKNLRTSGGNAPAYYGMGIRCILKS